MLLEVIYHFRYCILCFSKHYCLISFPFPYLLHLIFKMSGELFIDYIWNIFTQGIYSVYPKLCSFYRLLSMHIAPLEQSIDDRGACCLGSKPSLFQFFYYGSRGVPFWRRCFLVMHGYFLDIHRIVFSNLRKLFLFKFDIRPIIYEPSFLDSPCSFGDKYLAFDLSVCFHCLTDSILSKRCHESPDYKIIDLKGPALCMRFVSCWIYGRMSRISLASIIRSKLSF